MAIERWDPFTEAVSLRDAVNTLFQDSFVRPRGFSGAAGSGVGTFPIDVRETENDYVIHASLPGIKPDDVQITVHGDTLTIRAELKDEEAPADQDRPGRPGREGQRAEMRPPSRPA